MASGVAPREESSLAIRAGAHSFVSVQISARCLASRKSSTSFLARRVLRADSTAWGGHFFNRA